MTDRITDLSEWCRQGTDTLPWAVLGMHDAHAAQGPSWLTSCFKAAEPVVCHTIRSFPLAKYLHVPFPARTPVDVPQPVR